MPSGISCVRQGASRPSRSTIRSTASFAIRRQVVSLPPVIVIMPLDVSYSSALREMSTDFFGSPVEISGRTPANAPSTSPAPTSCREERVQRVEQVLHVLVGRLHALDVALVVVVGRADERLAEPRQHEDRAPSPGRRDHAGVHAQPLGRQHDVRPAARADHRHLGLVAQLVRAQPVGPHPGRVDDVRGAHRELGAALGVAHQRAVVGQRGRLDPVGRHRAEALGLGEHGQDEPHVVGLAVVEQVAARGIARGEGGDQLGHLGAVDHAVARGAPVLAAVEVGVARAATAERRAADPVDRHDVVHVQPDADEPVRPRAVEGGHDQRQRPHQMRRQRGHQLPLQQRLADKPEIEVLQVAQPAVHELARSRRRPARVIALLHQPDGVAAARGVERDAGAGDPATDDQHVERLVGQSGEGVVAGEHQLRWVTTVSSGARSGAGLDPRASPRCSRPSGTSPSGIPHAARPAGVRRTSGVRQ